MKFVLTDWTSVLKSVFLSHLFYRNSPLLDSLPEAAEMLLPEGPSRERMDIVPAHLPYLPSGLQLNALSRRVSRKPLLAGAKSGKKQEEPKTVLSRPSEPLLGLLWLGDKSVLTACLEHFTLMKLRLMLAAVLKSLKKTKKTDHVNNH